MAASGNEASEHKKIIGGVLIGVGTFQLLGTLTLPDLWAEALKHAVQVWWPLLLIVAGVLWLATAQRARAKADWKVKRTEVQQ